MPEEATSVSTAAKMIGTTSIRRHARQSRDLHCAATGESIFLNELLPGDSMSKLRPTLPGAGIAGVRGTGHAGRRANLVAAKTSARPPSCFAVEPSRSPTAARFMGHALRSGLGPWRRTTLVARSISFRVVERRTSSRVFYQHHPLDMVHISVHSSRLHTSEHAPHR